MPAVPAKPNPKTIKSQAAAKKPASQRKTARNRKTKRQSSPYRWLFLSIEALSLFCLALATVIFLLGHIARNLGGPDLLSNLLPFAITMLIMICIAAIFLLGWWRLRPHLQQFGHWLPICLHVSILITVAWWVNQDHFGQMYVDFRTLVGGKQEAERLTLSHQIYAAYRRYPGKQLQGMLERSQSFERDINEAARIYHLDPAVLQGVAATESSFLPRSSFDGGQGLFQITRIPKTIEADAAEQLDLKTLDMQQPRHNTFVAAATLSHYLQEMKGDLFLGLLAYNIGPKNGGLRFIMQQYGASDFATMQPYLQQLPRDYPIRVLSYALAFRIWHQTHQVLAYEEGDNAQRIQKIGIPGLY